MATVQWPDVLFLTNSLLILSVVLQSDDERLSAINLLGFTIASLCEHCNVLEREDSGNSEIHLHKILEQG